MTQAAHMQPGLGTRIVGRLVRDVKSIFGLDSYLRNADRYVLEQIIFPYFLCREQYRHILFVGCHWYTKGYNGYFEGTKNYLTIDVDPSKAKYGARRHIVDGMQNLTRHFHAGAIDLILCNGVFGWGLDAKEDVEKGFQGSFDCLRGGGVLVVGWDDIDERRPFYIEECVSLSKFTPMHFVPLGTTRFVTDTPYRHTFDFYVKEPNGVAGKALT
jgi:hypothetical protein